MGALRVRAEGLTKAYRRPDGRRVPAIRNCTLTVSAGDMVAVAGPPGAGKTTLLRLLAGLESPDSGSLTLNTAKTERPFRAMSFRDDALFPWLTVSGNVAFGLRLLGWPRCHQEDAVAHFARRLGFARVLEAYPEHLSPAMRRRVALARALAYDPELLLLDEPLAGQDEAARTMIVHEILSLWQARRAAVVYATRSLADANTLGGRILYLTR